MLFSEKLSVGAGAVRIPVHDSVLHMREKKIFCLINSHLGRCASGLSIKGPGSGHEE